MEKNEYQVFVKFKNGKECTIFINIHKENLYSEFQKKLIECL